MVYGVLVVMSRDGPIFSVYRLRVLTVVGIGLSIVCVVSFFEVGRVLAVPLFGFPLYLGSGSAVVCIAVVLVPWNSLRLRCVSDLGMCV